MRDLEAAWTIDQLSERVADALSTGYAGQSNGRVRGVPDIRTIRWYTSIGLLDRPAAMRGRTALYGRRHLVQIVAVKRLQAEGHSLASVQEQLIGVDDATLERIARLDDVAAPRPMPMPTVAPTSEPAPAPESGPDRSRFWSAPSPVSTPGSTPTPTSAEAAGPDSSPAAPSTPIVQGIRLSQDVTLLLGAAGRVPDEAARTAVENAAQPLLALLRRLGLTAS